MPYRHWLFIAALGCLTAEAALSQEPVPPDPEAQVQTPGDDQDDAAAGRDAPGQDQQRAPDLFPAIYGIEAAIRDLIAEQRNQTSQEPGDHEVRDLDAQEQMALWAYWMFVATAAAVVLTFAALLAIIRTLHHTKRAADAAFDMVDEAKATTTAAQGTIEVTRDIGQRQIRAYVQFDGVHCQPIGSRDDIDVRIGFDLSLAFINKGATPGRNCWCGQGGGSSAMIAGP